MTVSVQLEGFADLERALEDLSKSAGRGVMRRALIASAEPLVTMAAELAPDDPRTFEGDLSSSIAVSSKLSPRQRSQHKKMFKDDKASVEVFAGAGPVPQAHLQEFGTGHHAPQPFMRPAWLATQTAVLNLLKSEMKTEIDKAVMRAARKAARQAARS